jgi:C-terminal processing protease CtpA/Prc
VTVLREGKKSELEIAVRALPDKLGFAAPRKAEREEIDAETYYSKPLGLEVRNKNAEKGGEADPYEGFEGVVVERVDDQGLADEAGIGPSMLIRKVGRKSVSTITEFADAVEQESLEDGVMLQVRTSRGNSVILLKKNSTAVSLVGKPQGRPRTAGPAFFLLFLPV